MNIGELGIAIPFAAMCVLLSAFCAGTEVALFSLRRVDREQLARSDLGADRRILRLLGRPRRLIATVLIGSYTFNATLAVIAYAVVTEQRGSGEPDSATALVNASIALGVTLPLVVLVAEVTAKTVAAKAPLAWARAASLPLALFAFLITPVRLIVHYTSELLLRPLGASARTRPARDLSEEEFRKLVDAGSAQGQVDARERRLIHRVFEFSDKNVAQVMTPRERIFAVSYDLPKQRLVKELASRGFSRVPVFQKSLDNIRGIAHAKDFVRSVADKPVDKPLGDLLHPPLFVPRTTPVKRLFLTFKQKKVHMALVVSEYGKVLGLVTMDDLLAQIFGVLRDERAELQNSIPPGKLLVRGAATRPSASGDLTPPDAVKAVDPDATGPVDKSDYSGPVRRADTGDSGPVAASEPGPEVETGGGAFPVGEITNDRESRPIANPIVDPIGELPPGLQPIHVVDEITPPAADVQDLLDRGKRN